MEKHFSGVYVVKAIPLKWGGFPHLGGVEVWLTFSNAQNTFKVGALAIWGVFRLKFD